MSNISKSVSIHVDVDSPIVLGRFYGHTSSNYSISDLETFYVNTFRRAFALFDEYGIKATFFCVGEEIASSPVIAEQLREADKRGHAIANHTFSHPFGLNLLSDSAIKQEIELCNNAITKAISKPPIGFRAPGYAINTKIINILEENGITYDSSAGWPLMHVLFKAVFYLQLLIRKKISNVGYGETNSFFRKSVYVPRKENWKKKSYEKRNFIEFPLPASFYILPYYSNLHLLLPPGIRKMFMNATNSKHLTYLFHIIEFSSSKDDLIPKEIFNHPSIHIPYNDKLSHYRLILKHLLKTRTPILTENYVLI